MASQEFLASFAVEIDEGGVSRLQEVLEKFWAMDEATEAKLIEAFNLWLDGAPKKRLNYWMKKTNTTVEELNIYMTY